MGRDKVRLYPQRLVKTIRGFGVAIPCGEHAAQVKTGLRDSGFSRAASYSGWIASLALFRKGNSEIELRSANRWVDRDGFAKLTDPVSRSPCSAKCSGEYNRAPVHLGFCRKLFLCLVSACTLL